MTAPTVLKLGGSVLTRKDEPETVDEAAVARAAEAVAGRSGTPRDEADQPDDRDDVAAGDGEGDRPGRRDDGEAAATAPGVGGPLEGRRDHGNLVVVHGGGSFGHHHAERHGVSRTRGTHDAAAVRAIHGAMAALNRTLVDAFAERDVPAVPVHPFSAAHRDADGALHLPARQVDAMLDEGYVPVLHGDVVVQVGSGATVVSGDELVVHLARALGADRVGVCSGEPGVLDDDGAVVKHISSFDEVAAYLGDGEGTDVTGGMAAKVRELLALDAPAQVFGLDGLSAFLEGGAPGTCVE